MRPTRPPTCAPRNVSPRVACRAAPTHHQEAAERNDDDGPGVLDAIAHTVIYMVLQIVLGLFASMIVMWFSRHREFRADAGGARLAGRDSMIAALRRLAGDGSNHVLPDDMKAMGISGTRQSGLRALFMTHPPLADRIAALEQMPRNPA